MMTARISMPYGPTEKRESEPTMSTRAPDKVDLVDFTSVAEYMDERS